MNGWNVLDAELVDELQADRQRRRKPIHVRTLETKRSYPLPKSRAKPTLICAYCGRPRCSDRADLPALDPFYDA